MKRMISGLLVALVVAGACASMTGRNVVLPEGMKRPTTVAEGLQILADLKRENDELRRIIAAKENCRVPDEGG